VLGGVVADALGIRAVYYMGGVLLLVAGMIGFAGLPPASTRHGDGRLTARLAGGSSRDFARALLRMGFR
jgi:hypothetical protein